MTEKLFDIAKRLDSSLRPSLVDDDTEAVRPSCPNCGTRMLRDVSPRLPVPLPADGIVRGCWRCSWCWARLVIPPWGGKS
jgi:DNA-directed RNA polymerase subunit RPC12/RpoP